MPSKAAEDSLKYIPPVEEVAERYSKSLVSLASKNVLILDWSPRTFEISHLAILFVLVLFGSSSGFGCGL